jgi:hypothetical protein
MRIKLNPQHRFTALLFAGIIVVLSHFEALFLNASFLPSRQEFFSGRNVRRPWFGFEPKYRTPTHGFYDIGAAAWQWEPAQLFMRNCLRDRESPYWNPYSSCGALGPETMVDAKFSPISIAIALTGASSASFHIVLLGALFVGVYFCIRLLTIFVGVGIGASFLGGLVFAASGFALSTLNTQMGGAYLLTPPALYALTALSVTKSLRWLPLAGIALGLLLATSFISTLLLAAGFCFTFALFFPDGRFLSKATLQRFFLLLAAMVLGCLMTSCIWLPFLESLRFTTLAEEYARRKLAGLPFRTFFSLFSPEHFWESYNNFAPSGGEARALSNSAALIFHVGIGPGILALAALGSSGLRQKKFLWILILATVFAVGMQWRLFPFYWLGTLPVVRSIRPNYFASLITTGAWLLVAIGFEGLRERKGAFAALLGWTVPAALFCWLFFVLAGPHERAPEVALVGIFLAAYLVLLLLLAFGPARHATLRALLLSVCCLELFQWENHTYLPRRNLESHLPKFVEFLKTHVSDGRILNIGRRTLYPEWGSALQIPQVDTMNVSRLSWYQNFLEKGIVRPKRFGTFFLVVDPKGPPTLNFDSLRLMSVRFLVVNKSEKPWIAYLASMGLQPAFQDADRFIVPVPGHLPRAFVVREIRETSKLPGELNESSASIAMTTDQKFVDEATASLGKATMHLPVSAEADRLSITAYHNTNVTLEAHLGAPGILVLTDAWHPAWKVTVNGKPAYCARVDGAFRGVLLPAGQSKIGFTYKNVFVSVSVVCSSITALLLIVGACWAIFQMAFRGSSTVMLDCAEIAADDHRSLRGGKL